MSFSVRSPATAWAAVLAGSAALLLVASACSGDGGQTGTEGATATPVETPAEGATETPESGTSQSPELMLASINAGGEVSENDPSVDEFRAVLDVLEEKCPNERQEIADIGVGTHQAVTERGLDITLLQMMSDLSENIPPDLVDTGISCAIAFAAYVESEAPQ